MAPEGEGKEGRSRLQYQYKSGVEQLTLRHGRPPCRVRGGPVCRTEGSVVCTPPQWRGKCSSPAGVTG